VTATGPNGDDEQWRLRRDDLVVVDEAGTAETADLVAIGERCSAAGAKLLLVGDPRQLSAIGPGCMLADLAEHGISYQLSEVRRFGNDWEGPASLRLRDGDAEVLAEYDRRGRLVDGGTAEQAEAHASRAWLADTLTGRESLLMVGTNAAAARVSASLRAELVRLGRVEEDGVPLGMSDELADWRGVTVGLEDNVAAPITRKTYRVLDTRDDGGLTVAPIEARRPGPDAEGEWNDWGERLGAPLQLPGSYVREHVSLGYASTKDAAQGRTVDTGHSVNGAGEQRRLLRPLHPRPRTQHRLRRHPGARPRRRDRGDLRRRTAGPARRARRRHRRRPRRSIGHRRTGPRPHRGRVDDNQRRPDGGPHPRGQRRSTSTTSPTSATTVTLRTSTTSERRAPPTRANGPTRDSAATYRRWTTCLRSSSAHRPRSPRSLPARPATRPKRSRTPPSARPGRKHAEPT